LKISSISLGLLSSAAATAALLCPALIGALPVCGDAFMYEIKSITPPANTDLALVGAPEWHLHLMWFMHGRALLPQRTHRVKARSPGACTIIQLLCLSILLAFLLGISWLISLLFEINIKNCYTWC
jgi:hypothetical protein